MCFGKANASASRSHMGRMSRIGDPGPLVPEMSRGIPSVQATLCQTSET